MTTKKTIVAFDFDGTITYSDTLIEFIRFVCGNIRFFTGFFIHAPLLVAYKCHLYPNWKAKQRIFTWFFGGMPLETFNTLCVAFSKEKKDKLVRPAACQCIAEHLQAGEDTVIISASIDNWVTPIAESIGVKHVIGTQLEISQDNRLTGRFSTPNCYGQEKVNRLLQLYPDRSSYRLIAYGDSRGDKELLSFADEAHYKPFR